MTEYKGFQYQMIRSGLWKIKFPGGMTISVSLNVDPEVRAHIDSIIENFGG